MIRRAAVVAGLMIAVLLCSSSLMAQSRGSKYDPESLVAEAPKKFRAKFETSKGEFEILVKREWAPLGADRFYNLVQSGFYDDVRFFRVVEGFVVQFGISGKPAISRVWREATIEDDPVVESNTRGTISFAKSGKNSRTTQVFINLGNNTRLDQMGFSPFGRVVKGMTVVGQLYSNYAERITKQQHKIVEQGNVYLERTFPNLDYIEKATIVDE
jgi:peptidyl-prolyl cis-trans isomerase A (cyclophilin A)